MEELILLVFYESNNVFQERARVDDDVGLEEKLQIRDTQEIEKIESKKKSPLALPPPLQEQSQELPRDWKFAIIFLSYLNWT